VNEIEERPAIDLLDFCFLTAGAACPPLLLLAVGQWVLRRNHRAVAWIEQRATRMIEERLGLPAPTPPPLALPAPPQSPEANDDLLSMLTDCPHLLVVGHTGGGKTTLLHGLARHLSRDATVIVCDPDAIDGDYPGYRVVGAGDDYEAIGRALVSVRDEVAQRREQRKQGQRTFAPLWVLCDEVHDIIREIDGAWDILEDLIRRGRKLNVHCAIGTQDAQVKSLGLEGKSKLLDNLVRVDVRVRDGRRVAVIGGSDYVVPDLPNPDDTVQKSVVQTSPDSFLAALLATSPAQSEAVDRNQSRPVQTSPADQSETARDQSSRPIPDHQQIRRKFNEVGSKNKVYEWLKESYGVSSKGTAYAIINAALDTSEQSDDDDDDAPPLAFKALLG
jgi:energy-coupling factor transporter ATP-binding protein EcfA2